MFIMDVPYTPAQQTPIVLAQAAAPGVGAPQPDFILKDCQETEHASSAFNGVDPAGALAVYIGNRDGHDIYGNSTEMAAIKIALLEGTKHGDITASVTNTGRTSYHYEPEPDYVGKDRAVFMAEFEGKRYKIVIDLVVHLSFNENAPVCPATQLIKVKKPASGSTGLDLGVIPVTFTDLTGSAFGQTDATGITLDNNATNYNWFIAPQPTTANPPPSPTPTNG